MYMQVHKMHIHLCCSIKYGTQSTYILACEFTSHETQAVKDGWESPLLPTVLANRIIQNLVSFYLIVYVALQENQHTVSMQLITAK